MSYDAEAHCALADAERDRNALLISASLVNLLSVWRRAPNREMEKVALQFPPYAQFPYFAESELI